MPWITQAESHIGGREEQQDRFLVESSDDGNSHILMVADGAGGHKTGGLAAQTAVDCVKQNLEYLWSCNDPEAFLYKLIIECNERVLGLGDDDLVCTTIVIALLRGDEAYWGHVGDSRFYLIRDSQIVVKTSDHSLIEMQRQRAAVDKSFTVTAPTNKLYMCLGALPEISPAVASSITKVGDTLLLCSDGLWNQVNMNTLISSLSQHPFTVPALQKWTKKANSSHHANGDNITAVAARLVAAPSLWSRLLAVFR